jgi:hypothetical protein
MRFLLHIRYEVVVVFALWYDSQWIFQIGLSSGFLGEPYFVEGLAGDAAREVSVKLEPLVR